MYTYIHLRYKRVCVYVCVYGAVQWAGFLSRVYFRHVFLGLVLDQDKLFPQETPDLITERNDAAILSYCIILYNDMPHIYFGFSFLAFPSNS